MNEISVIVCNLFNSLRSYPSKVNAGYQLRKRQHKKMNHLLFMHDLMLYWNKKREAERLTNTVRIFSKDTANKYAYVTMKTGKLVSVGGMELSSGEVIPELESDKGYKYLGISVANDPERIL